MKYFLHILAGIVPRAPGVVIVGAPAATATLGLLVPQQGRAVGNEGFWPGRLRGRRPRLPRLALQG
jgi:hypothetical protein